MVAAGVGVLPTRSIACVPVRPHALRGITSYRHAMRLWLGNGHRRAGTRGGGEEEDDDDDDEAEAAAQPVMAGLHPLRPEEVR